MPVELKKEIRKRVACQTGSTQEDLRKAEEKCHGELYFAPNELGVLESFYLLHVPVRGKITPTFLPTYYFVGHSQIK